MITKPLYPLLLFLGTLLGSVAFALETTDSFKAPSLTLVRGSDGVQVPIDLSNHDNTERMLCYDASQQKIILGKATKQVISGYTVTTRHWGPSESMRFGGNGCATDASFINNILPCPTAYEFAQSSKRNLWLAIDNLLKPDKLNPNYDGLNNDPTISSLRYLCKVGTAIRYIEFKLGSTNPYDVYPAETTNLNNQSLLVINTSYNYVNQSTSSTGRRLTLICNLPTYTTAPATECLP